MFHHCRALAVAVAWSAMGMSGAMAAGLGSLREPPTVYPMDVGRETRETAALAPSSNLNAMSALVAATTISLQVKGARVMAVAPTGSMTPMFNQKAYLVVEPADFNDLRIGDIITYEHPKLHRVIVHRILEKRGNAYWTKGDHNDRMDNTYVTRENYLMRVFAIIYARNDAAPKVAPDAAVSGNLALANADR